MQIENHKEFCEVSDFFSSSARDWTPASMRAVVQVLYMPASNNPKISARCGLVLSNDENLRADRFVTESGKAHYIERRAFRRYCAALALGSLGLQPPLSKIVFQETEKGHPYLPDHGDLWFSFSACATGFLGAWSSTHAVGVDIEDLSRDLDAASLADRYFTESEAKLVRARVGAAQLHIFLQYWTLKEAALKSIGEGLPFGLDAFEFDLFPNPTVLRAPGGICSAAGLNAQLIGEADYSAALVIRQIN